MKLYGIAFTERGMDTASEIGNLESLDRCQEGELREWTENHWETDSALIFIGAAGIAVRAIAPLIKSKTEDPAVIVIDEKGNYVIPILSGHIGGANALAMSIARELAAEPIITTATDINGTFAIDTWAKEQGLAIRNPEAIKEVSSALLNDEEVGFFSELPISGDYPEGFILEDPFDVIISPRDFECDELHLVPKCITLGIGCKKDTPAEKIEALFKKIAICEEAVIEVATVDLKKDEPGLLEFCEGHGFQLKTYSADELQAVDGDFTSSALVEVVTGVDNVCERASAMTGGKLLIRKTAQDGVTMACSITDIGLSFGGK